MGGPEVKAKREFVGELSELILKLAEGAHGYYGEDPPEVAAAKAFAEREGSLSPELREAIRGREGELISGVAELIGFVRGLANEQVERISSELLSSLRWYMALAAISGGADYGDVEEYFPIYHDVEAFARRYHRVVRRKAREIAARLLRG